MDAKLGSGGGNQFTIGLLLGAVWSPCTGPTLGAAALLASQGQNLGQVALTMVAFGIGVAIPLIALGLMSREVMLKWRGRMLSASSGLKIAMGGILALTGMLILTGQDRLLESTLVDLSPTWLTTLTTSI
jgi:cytochrome c-type biogenesis protein